jgi:hypothetical protein
MDTDTEEIRTPAVTRTIYQLGFLCGQQSPQHATTASGLDKKESSNQQLPIIKNVINNISKMQIMIYINLINQGGMGERGVSM